MNCEEICLLLSDYFDQELDAEICFEIDQHIKLCFYCECQFNNFSKTLELCHNIEQVEIPQKVHMQIIRLIRIEIKKRKG